MIKLKEEYRRERITFPVGEFHLHGILHLPENHNPPVVIGSHGLLSNKSSPKQIELARQCNTAGIGFFRFDHRGCGDSQGKFEYVTSLNSRKNDILGAINALESYDVDNKQIGIFGSSMGGAACLSVAKTPGIKAVVIYGSPLRISKLIDISDLYEEAEKSSRSRETMTLEFDISDQLQGIRNILIFHGDTDETVPFSNSLEIYEKVDEPKKLIPLKNGDHLMTNKTHQDFFMKETVGWFKKHFLF